MILLLIKINKYFCLKKYSEIYDVFVTSIHTCFNIFYIRSEVQLYMDFSIGILVIKLIRIILLEHSLSQHKAESRHLHRGRETKEKNKFVNKYLLTHTCVS